MKQELRAVKIECLISLRSVLCSTKGSGRVIKFTFPSIYCTCKPSVKVSDQRPWLQVVIILREQIIHDAFWERHLMSHKRLSNIVKVSRAGSSVGDVILFWITTNQYPGHSVNNVPQMSKPLAGQSCWLETPRTWDEFWYHSSVIKLRLGLSAKRTSRLK